MPLVAPNLDDRTFRDIVDEAKTLIPRYAPEWTDHNDSDPGISLLQLYAWMTDIMLYRLNRVPERNYIKFLQLLGIELKPGQPASAELTFTLSRDDVDHVLVPKGTQIAAAEPGPDGESIVFETDATLTALGAELASVQVFDGFSYSLETTKNEAEGQTLYPFGVYAREGSALLLGFDSPVAFTEETVDLAVMVHEAAATKGLSCSLSLGVLPLPATLAWEYWNGAEWKSMILDKDETQAFSLSGHIYLRGPGSAIPKAQIGDETDELYWIRCRLEKSYYEASPQLAIMMTNTVRATQAVTIDSEVLGGSNGRPDQSFFLSNVPVVPLANPETVMSVDEIPVTINHVRLEVSERAVADEDKGFQVWKEVSDFNASKSDDSHYTLNRTTGEIRFGDGKNGRIPVANPALPNNNVVARLYRYGGGSAGNVGSDTLTSLQSYVEGVKGVTNPFPANGGSDEETVDEAKLRAPAELKSRNRAVTAEDFELLARQTPGVKVQRAKALPLFHPSFPGVEIPGVVTIIVVPDSEDDQPSPGPRTIRAVCDCLNQRRLLTTEVCVIPPTYRKVKIAAEIVVRPQDDLATVKRAIEDSLTAYFHPLHGGDDGLGWPFGQTIFYSRVYQRILQVDGVDRIDNNQLEIYLDDMVGDFCRDVSLERGDLLYSDQHEISVDYQR